MSNLQIALLICTVDSIIVAIVFFAAKKHLARKYYRFLFGLNSATVLNILFAIIYLLLSR